MSLDGSSNQQASTSGDGKRRQSVLFRIIVCELDSYELNSMDELKSIQEEKGETMESRFKKRNTHNIGMLFLEDRVCFESTRRRKLFIFKTGKSLYRTFIKYSDIESFFVFRKSPTIFLIATNQVPASTTKDKKAEKSNANNNKKKVSVVLYKCKSEEDANQVAKMLSNTRMDKNQEVSSTATENHDNYLPLSDDPPCPQNTENGHTEANGDKSAGRNSRALSEISVYSIDDDNFDRSAVHSTSSVEQLQDDEVFNASLDKLSPLNCKASPAGLYSLTEDVVDKDGDAERSKDESGLGEKGRGFLARMESIKSSHSSSSSSLQEEEEEENKPVGFEIIRMATEDDDDGYTYFINNPTLGFVPNKGQGPLVAFCKRFAVTR